MSTKQKLDKPEDWCLQICPICGRSNYMVIRGDREIGNRHEIYPDMGYSFCNCNNIFYTRSSEYDNPVDMLKELYHTLPEGKDYQFILPDSYFINWDNIYEFKHWKLREIPIIWDIDSFCALAEKLGFTIKYRERVFDVSSKDAQKSIVMIGKLKAMPRQATQAAMKYFGDREIVVAEVGVMRGEHAQLMIDNLCISRLHLVDAWAVCKDFYEPQRQSKHLRMVEKRFENNERVYIHVIDSVKGAEQFQDGSLDFVYIDADHSYQSVKTDIAAWLPKVKKGGIISGHDYDYALRPSVKEAVDEIFGIERVYHGYNEQDTLEDWWVYV